MSISRAPLLASLALLLATLFWGTSFPAMKAAADAMPPGLVVGVRWALAALALAPCIAWRDRRLWRDAALLGVPLFIGFVLQVLGLTLMSAGRNAFLTGLSVILVPLMLAGLGGKTHRRALLSALLATAGIVVMSYEQGSSGLGDVLTLGCALAFAIYVIGMERLTPGHGARSLAGAQAVVMTALCPLWIVAEWLFWGDAYPARAQQAVTVWPQLLYLGLACTALALILQTWAQARVSAVQAAVIYTLEPFFATLFGVWWLGELFGLRGMLGGALVIAAMLLSQWPARDRQPLPRA